MTELNKQALRTIAAAAESAPSWYAVGEFGDVVDPANPEWKSVHEFCKAFTAERVLALLDELEAAESRLSEILKPNILLPVIDGLDEYQLRRVIKNCTENYSLLHSKWEAAEKRIAEMKELLQWPHDTLLEINPSNYTHDDVCEANAAAEEVIRGIAPILGETHGKANEWRESRAAGIRINGEG